MIPLPTLSPKLIGIIAGALAVAGLLFLLSVRTNQRNAAIEQAAAVQASFDQTVASYRAARDQARRDDQINTMRVGKQQAAISEETLDDYQKRIADLRADFAERVRAAQARADSGGGGEAGVPSAGTAAGGTDEAPRQAVFPSKDALIASEQAEQLIALQAWVRKQAAVDVNGITTPPE